MKRTFLLLLLLAGRSSFVQAQSGPATDSLRQRGELTGARPSGDLLAKPPGRAAAPRPASPSPVQQHLLNAEVDLAQVAANQLPDLYEHFISTTRDERRQWSYQDWAGAGEVLARLNQRYEQVRTELPLEERVRIRTCQGEFHALRGARRAKNKLD